MVVGNTWLLCLTPTLVALELRWVLTIISTLGSPFCGQSQLVFELYIMEGWAPNKNCSYFFQELYIIQNSTVILKNHYCDCLWLNKWMNEYGRCNNCPWGNCPRRKLSKGQFSKETVLQGDYCPTMTFVQGHYCPSRLFQGGSYINYCPSKRVDNLTGL